MVLFFFLVVFMAVQTTAKISIENLSREELVKIVLDQQAVTSELHLLVSTLQAEVARLKKWVHGSKTEKFIPSLAQSSQLGLGIEAELVNACSVTGAKRISYIKTTTEEKPVSHPGRMKLPDNLRRETTVIEPEGDTKGLRKIGEDITEILEYKSSELFVKRIVRPKYAKPGNSGVIMGSLPERALEKTIFGERLLTQIMVDKFVDHLPLHRQNERFKRYGVNIPSSTLSDAVRNVCNLIQPLGVALLQELMEASYLGVDETPIPVQDRDKKGVTHKGYFWVYYSTVKKLVYFDYRQGRGREGPLEMLKDYIGYLQCDGYGAYDIFEKNKAIILLACMAHARRLFIESLDNDRATSEYVLERMQELYAIESDAKDLSFEERKRVRQDRSVPILEHLGRWTKETYIKAYSGENDIVKNSSTAKALAYCIQRWDKLSRYCENGILLIDNNPVERSIRPVKLGAKNYLFAGSHEAAKRSALLYSLFSTCKLHGINPEEWLSEVLTKLPTHPINRIKDLLPHNWEK